MTFTVFKYVYYDGCEMMKTASITRWEVQTLISSTFLKENVF